MLSFSGSFQGRGKEERVLPSSTLRRVPVSLHPSGGGKYLCRPSSLTGTPSLREWWDNFSKGKLHTPALEKGTFLLDCDIPDLCH